LNPIIARRPEIHWREAGMLSSAISSCNEGVDRDQLSSMAQKVKEAIMRKSSLLSPTADTSRAR
jgi:hypothetical protein